jgi:hypothetical protein
MADVSSPPGVFLVPDEATTTLTQGESDPRHFDHEITYHPADAERLPIAAVKVKATGTTSQIAGCGWRPLDGCDERQ